MEQISQDWEDNFDEVFKSYMDSHTVMSSVCSICKSFVNINYINCSTCINILCSECDINFHTSHPFHNRAVMQGMCMTKLKAIQFWNPLEQIIVQKGTILSYTFFILRFSKYYSCIILDVPVPCLVPTVISSGKFYSEFPMYFYMHFIVWRVLQ